MRNAIAALVKQTASIEQAAAALGISDLNPTPPITNSNWSGTGAVHWRPCPFGEQPAAEPAIRRILKCKSLLFHFD